LTAANGGCNSQTTFNINTWNTPNTGYPIAQGGDITGLSGGYYYVNVHTVNNPGGEIYGFLFNTGYTGSLGAVSGVTTNANGITNVLLNAGTFTVFVTIPVPPASAIQLCHIHYATNPGGSGSPIYNMTTSNSGGCNAQTTFYFNSWNTPNTGYPVSQGGDISGFSGGYYYVNVHTVTNPSGEIYGFLTSPNSITTTPSPSPNNSGGAVAAAVIITILIIALLIGIVVFLQYKKIIKLPFNICGSSGEGLN